MKSSLTYIFTICVAVLMMGVVTADAQADNQDTVIDGRKTILKNTWGNCVRTKWNAGSDACAPKIETPKPIAQPAPPPPPAAPKPIVSKDARTIYFGFDKDELTDEATAKLNSLATAIRASNRVLRANIVGYADEMGKDDYNMELSERRANAVQAYLARLVQIPTSVAETRGLGESATQTDCKGKRNRIACMQEDRRVEVEFEYQH